MLLVTVVILIISLIAFKLHQKWLKRELISSLKWSIAWCYMHIINWHAKPLFDFDNKSKDPAKWGMKALPKAIFTENPRPLGNNTRAIDSLSFSGVSNHGDIAIFSIARRHGRSAEVVVYIRLATTGEEYHLPIQPHGTVYNTDGKTFSAAGLTFDVLEPLRCWRIIFNGQLRKGGRSSSRFAETDCDEIVPVKFNFIWHPMNDYVAFPHDFNLSLIADMVTQQNDKSIFVNPTSLFPFEWYDQFGAMNGILNIAGQDDKMELLVRGLKDRQHGNLDWSTTTTRVSIMGLSENGTSFHFFTDDTNGIQNFKYGYVLPPSNLNVLHVKQWFSDIKLLQDLPDQFQIRFIAGECRLEYDLQMINSGQQFQIFKGEDWECKINVKMYKVNLNGNNGFAIIHVGQPNKGGCTFSKQKSVPFLEESDIEESDKIALPFSDVECRSSKIVGGKGASLALISSIQNEENCFLIPDGLCLTKKAFSQHLTANLELKHAISSVEAVAWKIKDGSLEDECQKVIKLFLASTITPTLQNELKQLVKKTFKEDYESKRFAVRSSAIGEDGEELSAAGQNETFLGVKSLYEICLAVIKCWASQFSYRSVEYKRQNGQLINNGMGVVIQEMVPADIAGVLFSRHPTTGSPTSMVITANYGLGESVVSATVDPDCITLHRTFFNEISIKEKHIGSKKSKIQMSDTGTVSEEISPDKASLCSLSDEIAVKLGMIAVKLEQQFGSTRDIEWALYNNKIYLLQSRPVTSNQAMTEFEINHEFDTAFRTDKERLTTANVSEVIPGAITPLSITVTVRRLTLCHQSQFTQRNEMHRYDPTVVDTFPIYFSHCFMDRILNMSINVRKDKDAMTKAFELGIYGRIIDDKDLFHLAKDRFADNETWTMKKKILKYFLKSMVYSSSLVKRNRKKFNSEYYFPIDNSSNVEDVYKKLETFLSDFTEVAECHLLSTIGSLMWSFTIFSILPSQKDNELERYSDFANVVGSCIGAESGDVPVSLLNLANSIAEEIEPLKFQAMDPNEAATWLKNNNTTGKMFHEFMLRHGHRGYKEFDLGAKPFREEPARLAHVLQGMLKSKDCFKQLHNNISKDIFTRIKTPLTPIRKKLLQLMLPIVRNAVCNREHSKSMAIKVIDVMRESCTHLAKLLQQNGMLPDPVLIHFLRFDEILLLIKKRNPILIRRARQRLRQFPLAEAMIFPEMIDGIPKMVTEKPALLQNGTVQLTGYPACHGYIKGKAKVVASFEQVGSIEPGDILVTRATDVCWSPYFPLISGLVTEIGGLLSHGVVIAREFGLPCVIGVLDATETFKTGDTIELNANKGTVTKVE